MIEPCDDVASVATLASAALILEIASTAVVDWQHFSDSDVLPGILPLSLFVKVGMEGMCRFCLQKMHIGRSRHVSACCRDANSPRITILCNAGRAMEAMLRSQQRLYNTCGYL